MYVVYVILCGTLLVSGAAFMDYDLNDKLIGHPHSVHYAQAWYRLLTAGLIHFDMPHLFLNMYGLWTFASPVMDYLYWARWGWWRQILFFILYVGGMLTAHLWTYHLHKDDLWYYHLGASAGVVAVMTAAALANPTMQIGVAFIPITIPAILFVPIYLLCSLLLSHTPSRIGHLAHFTGGIYGLVFMAFIRLLG